MRAAVREAALTAGYPPAVAEWLAVGTRAAARLVPELSAEVVAPGRSKIGGLADLAASSEWPRGEHGPMTFCGQVAMQDVEFLRGVDGWRPPPGLLLFFADKDPDGDNLEAGRVLFEGASVERRDAPGDLHPHSRFDEAPARVVPALSPPSIDLIADGGDEDLDYEGDESELWEAFTSALALPDGIREPAHQLLGEPVPLADIDPLEVGSWQLGMEIDSLQERDRVVRLLAQFTTDHEFNIDMADGGIIYFVIRLEDLQAGNYDRVAVRIETS